MIEIEDAIGAKIIGIFKENKNNDIDCLLIKKGNKYYRLFACGGGCWPYDTGSWLDIFDIDDPKDPYKGLKEWSDNK